MTSTHSRFVKLEEIDKKLDKLDGLCESVDKLFSRIKISEVNIGKLDDQMSDVKEICDNLSTKFDELNAEKDCL